MPTGSRSGPTSSLAEAKRLICVVDHDSQNASLLKLQPFSSFPADFTQLPTVAVVIPNEQNDMHDGTIAQGDAWLQSNIEPYRQWAMTHNSLLILTFDEDDTSATNQIFTLFLGPMVAPGDPTQMKKATRGGRVACGGSLARLRGRAGEGALAESLCRGSNPLPSPPPQAGEGIYLCKRPSSDEIATTNTGGAPC